MMFSPKLARGRDGAQPVRAPREEASHWLGAADEEGIWLPEIPQIPEVRLLRGSLMIELRNLPASRAMALLSTGAGAPSAALVCEPGGILRLTLHDRSGQRHIRLNLAEAFGDDHGRVVYSWDSAACWGRLSAESLDGVRAVTRQFRHPVAPSMAAAVRLIQAPRPAEMPFLAVSRQVEPIGPLPGLTPDTPCETPLGELPAAALPPGAHAGSGPLAEPILAVLHRTVPAMGMFAPVRLRAPYFGLREDIRIAPHHCIVMRGAEVEYLFGREAVLVPSRFLVNGSSALRERRAGTVTYAAPVTRAHTVMDLCGLPAETCFAGRIRRKPALLKASLLCRQPQAALPDQGSRILPVLRPFEAVSLSALRAA